MIDRRAVLYVSYDGLLDPIGQSQVVPHVIGLAARGWRMSVLSFEKPGVDLEARDHLASRLRAGGVRWLPKRYHKRPTVPATALDVAVGSIVALAEVQRTPLACVHARSYVSASIALGAKRISGTPILFDMRGFWPDEKIESGAWKRGLLYETVKRMERTLFDAADAVVSLTESGKRELERWPNVGGRRVPISVIPTCVDLERYRGLCDLERGSPITIGYVGSVGGRYLIDETVQIFREIRALVPDARLHVLTPREQTPLWRACAKHRVPESAVVAEGVRSEDVPLRLGAIDATICLIKPGFASLASCPTKFGESLAAGCPVIVNPGIGDCAEIVRGEHLGAVTELDSAGYREAARTLLAVISERQVARRRCFDAARKLLGLDRALDEYNRLYTLLAARAW